MSEHPEGSCTSSESTVDARQSAPGTAGAMNAYDIPRYNSEGFGAGRPGMANDPASAGNIQGDPAGNASQQTAGNVGGPARGFAAEPAPGAMGYGPVNAPYGQAMGQPGVQPPPQSVAYGGMDPAYGQAYTAQPGFRPPPQSVAYGGMNPAYGQAYMVQPGFQPPPQGMAYAGMDPAYGQPYMGQPGFQPPPGPMDPAQAAATGYYRPYPGDPQPQAAAEGAAPGLDAEHYGRIAEVVTDIANGKQPDMEKIAALYSGFDAQFWKGALIGAVLTVLLTSKPVKNAVAGTLGGIFGAFQKGNGPATDAGTEPDAP